MTLDERIAQALTDDAVKSRDLVRLVAEVEVATPVAEKAAEAARLRALDPALSPDPAKARAAMDEAAFTCDRLRTALPRVQARYYQILSAEAYADWLLRYQAIQPKQAAAAQRLQELYRAFEAEIIPLLLDIEKIDREAFHIDWYRPKDTNNCPCGDVPSLGKTERLARGDRNLSIMTDLKLPAWAGNELVWPPHRPMSLGLVMGPLPGPPSTPEQVAARNTAQQEEGERVKSSYETRQGERQEREAKEAREAGAQEIKDRNRRAGWG
jgi:hypothetical protein